MAVIDVVSLEMSDFELCAKFPSDDLRLKTRVVVYPTQVAFFVKGGQICDKFEAGTYELSTENLPILNKIINLPYGGNSPFKAEVWFVNLTTKMDMKWGTGTPIQLEDPKYGIIVPIRAYGQYGIRIVDPRMFLTKLVGNFPSFSAYKVNEYFKGRMLSTLGDALSKKIAADGVSILQIGTHLVEMSEYCGEKVNEVFNQYGIELTDFSFISINFPPNDPSIMRLKEAKDMAAKLKIMGRDVYQMERSFNVLDKAAGNEGAGGSMIGMGAGLGAGMGIGQNFSNIATQSMNTSSVATPPPLPPTYTYFVYVDGQQLPNMTAQRISEFIIAGKANRDTLVWRTGLANWMKLAEVPELSNLCPPPMSPVVPPQM